MTATATAGRDDDLVAFQRVTEELQRRRVVAVHEAARVLDVPGADVGASLFMAVHAARTCHEAIRMLAEMRDEATVPA